MRISAGFMGAMALGLAVMGCNSPAPRASGGVAILDLEAVAKRLGREESIMAELKATSESLGEKVTATQNSLQQQFEQERAAMGQTPSEADQQKLSKLQEDLSAQLQAKQQEAQAELNKKRAAAISRFHEEVRPVARAVASERGLDVILAKSDVVFNVEPSVDITDAVVAKLITNPPPAAPAAASPAPATP